MYKAIQKGWKSFRLEMPDEVHAMVKRAAKLDHEAGTMTRFIWMAARERAQRILERQD